MALTAEEQYAIELINRARLDPLAEAKRYGLSASGVDGAAKQVVAPTVLLENASVRHGEWILKTGTFSHYEGAKGSAFYAPVDRVKQAGYKLDGPWRVGENIALTDVNTRSAKGAVEFHHEQWMRSTSHRSAMLDGDYREVGYGQVLGKYTGVNVSVGVQNFAFSGTRYFVTGVAYTDRDKDNFYSIGEGVAGLAMKIVGGVSLKTGVAGGYTLTSSKPAKVTVEIGSGTSLTRLQADLTSSNVKIDVVNNAVLKVAGNVTLLSGALRDVVALGVGDVALTGSADANRLTGNAGKNLISGGAGADTLRGEAGNDTLNGEAGRDVIYGGTGNDRLLGGADSDLLYGGTGNDSLFGGTGNDTLWGEAGNDRLEGGAGNDTLWGGTGNDTLLGGTENDSLSGDAGNDYLDGGTGNDVLRGGEGNDTLLGGTGQDSLLGEAGNDRLSGGAGNDTLRGGAGNDTLFGDGDQDFLFGDAGNDYLDGGAGNDTVSGGAGNDILFGGSGNDRMYGDSGDDRLNGGSGNDILTGGTGADNFVFSKGTGRDQVTDFSRAENDHLLLSKTLWGGATLSAAQIVSQYASVQNQDVVLTFGTDQIVLKGLGTLTGLSAHIDII